MVAAAKIEVRGLAKKNMKELSRQAKRLGLTPEQYVKEMVEERLDIAREARTKTFAQITGGGRQVDEEELDRLVERARERHYQRSKKMR